MRHGLFQQHMHASFEEIARDTVMQRGWYSDADDIDSADQLMVIGHGYGLVFLGYGCNAILVTIGHTDQLDIEQLTIDPNVVLAHLANTHRSSSYFLHHRVPLPVCIRCYHDRGYGKSFAVMNRDRVVNAQ